MKFLRDTDHRGMLDEVAFGMYSAPRSASLEGQAAAFFSKLEEILRQTAPLLKIRRADDHDQMYGGSPCKEGCCTGGGRSCEGGAIMSVDRELVEWTSWGEALLWAQTVLSLPPRKQVICKRLLICMSNRRPGPISWPEITQMLLAAGMAPAEIARVRAPIEESLKQAAEVVHLSRVRAT